MSPFWMHTMAMAKRCNSPPESAAISRLRMWERSVANRSHCSFHSLRDLVDILGLDQRFQVILQDLSKVVLQLRATEIPQPMHSSSEMVAILSLGVTSMQSLPILTTGQLFLHSCLHRFGLQRSAFTIAIRELASKSNIMLEVCIDSLQSAINAIHGGADELELCSSLAEGGLTPSVGLVKHVMCLVNTEMSTMLADVAIFKAMGVDRLVFGALTDVQEIDEAKCTLAVLAAYPLPLTFHRAFDICKNPIFSIEKIIKLGFSRVLTSGQRSSVEDQLAFKCISDLMGLYKDRIEIMPGAGINIDNVGKYIELGCPIVHSSCKAVRNLPRIENNLCMGTGTTESISYTDEKNVIKLQYGRGVV
ncbi:hypothetical protein MSG28_011851 [Choristoneura fumiferana]|uniref:Uncharacterized protein n=1 Tax=Choristoneura fumiferana TaxID=7141 RepID=A0ACC0KM05_CHOFU|nr:hypothetical protein MSG28_011851 [Choristoneura fumiferana]